MTFEERQARAVEQLMACSHDFEVRVRQVAGGQRQYLRQCVHCGERLWPPVPRATVNCAMVRPFDEGAEGRRRDQRRAAYERLRDAERTRERAEWFACHDRYLQTPQWQRLRVAVLERAHHWCEGCGQRRATIAHHLHYQRWQREMLFDLVAVCDECHRQIHEKPEQE
jgi:hypothetical protein